MAKDYVAVNRANWNSRVPFHERGYGLDAYRADPGYLSNVVRFDLSRLGDVTGLTGVHLQCHIGTDTLSLARLGAHMTGLDFSAPALEVARRLAGDCGATIAYVEAELDSAVEALGRGRFDFVYTGIGALCWLPEIRRWAEIVSALLKPGGRLFMREGHPMLWSLSTPRPDELVVVDYPYFETGHGTTFADTKTYVEHEGELASPRTIEFNHGLAQIISALMDAGRPARAAGRHVHAAGREAPQGSRLMRTLDWYFDFISPYAYLQCARFPALPAGVEVCRKPVLLSALLDHAGTLGPAEVPGKREFTYRQVLWLARRNGVPLRFPARHPFNPLAVLRLAVAIGASPEPVRRIFDFIWAEGRDPSDPAEFAALADALGIEPEVAGAHIGDPAVKARLKTNTDEAIAAGVWGVPTFVVDGRCFWGFDAGDMLLDYLADPSQFSTAEHARIASLPGIVRRRRLEP